MKYLWAPWRMNYILKDKEKGCIFCKKPKEEKDEKNLILFKSDYAFVIMNRYPYNNGHLMVVPKRHCIEFNQLKDEEICQLFYLLRASTQILKKTLHPHGFNIGMNIGKVGGAGEEHIHFHIVPRWEGDNNFMAVLSETKIIPEHLKITYRNLRSAFKGLMVIRKSQKGKVKE